MQQARALTRTYVHRVCTRMHALHAFDYVGYRGGSRQQTYTHVQLDIWHKHLHAFMHTREANQASSKKQGDVESSFSSRTPRHSEKPSLGQRLLLLVLVYFLVYVQTKPHHTSTSPGYSPGTKNFAGSILGRELPTLSSMAEHGREEKHRARESERTKE